MNKLKEAISKGVYSLYNGWINRPEYSDSEVENISDELNELTKQAKNCNTIKEINSFIDTLYKNRQSGLLSGGELSKDNLLFKELRNNGVLQELKDKKVELENKEMSLTRDKENYNESLQEDVDDKILLIAEYFDVDPEEVEDNGDDVYNINGDDYIVCTEDEAYNKAVEEIEMIFDDLGIESFTKNFQDEILNNPDMLDTSFIKDFIDQEIEYFKNEEQDENMAEYLEDLNDLEALEYMRDIYGDELNDILKDHIDVEAVAEEAINWDGIAHFIAQYDGEEIDLDNGYYAYRID